MQKMTKSQKQLLVKIESEVLSGNLSSLLQLVQSSTPSKTTATKPVNKPLSFQSKTLNIINSMIEKYGFESIKVSEYANTGKLSIQKSNRFGELGKITYDFQSDTLTLSITIGNKQIMSQPPRKDYFAFYMRHSDVRAFENFLSSLESELKGLK